MPLDNKPEKQAASRSKSNSKNSDENHQGRPLVIAGNWKMYKTAQEAVQYIETLTPLLQMSQAAVYLAVPFTAIAPSSEKVKQLNSSIVIGAQNMNDASEGAFTGEIAVRMLKEAGAEFVILGHSERRHIFHEDDEFINRKVKRACAERLLPILCIGETLEEREQGRTEEVLERQLKTCLDGISKEYLKGMVLAYEPVWAIGTGKVASPEDAGTAHAFCRHLVAEYWGAEVAASLVIQYGGSVKPDNAAQLLSHPDIDGLLVGGASLSPESFIKIINQG